MNFTIFARFLFLKKNGSGGTMSSQSVQKQQQIFDRRKEREAAYLAQADEKAMRKEDIMALERSKIFAQLMQDQQDGVEIPFVTSMRNMGWEPGQAFDAIIFLMISFEFNSSYLFEIAK